MSHLMKILNLKFCHRIELIILEIYNKYESIWKSGSWWKNELKELCIKIDTAWRPRVNINIGYSELIYGDWYQKWVHSGIKKYKPGQK